MNIDPTTTKYVVKAEVNADGVVEKPDVIGAIFGQTEGLLGEDLDLRDLQKSGRIGRIEVEISSKKGKSQGTITLPSSLDRVETAILGSAIETIDRVGPCKATIKVAGIEDVRTSKRKVLVDRAKELLADMMEDSKGESYDLIDDVKDAVRVEEMVKFKGLPAGPNVESSDAILIVEGRNDVANLLTHGIKNAIAVEGTNIPEVVKDMTKNKVSTALVDGDRGGELLLKELLQTCEIDFVARAPNNTEVEELTQKGIMKTLRNKMPAEQFLEQHNIQIEDEEPAKQESNGGRQQQKQQQQQQDRQKQDRQKQRDRPKPRRRDRSERTDQRDQKPAQKDEPAARAEATDGSSDEGPRTWREYLDHLGGSLQAIMMDPNGKEIGDPIPVRELADTLRKSGDKVGSVVFDGVITQRLLDIAVEKDIKTLVGAKLGNVNKTPSEVEVLTRANLD